MKKYLFIALAAAALTSCSNDDTIDIQKEAISFSNAFIDNNTRAADPSLNNTTLKEFNVYGSVTGIDGTTKVEIFNGETVSGIVGTTEGNPNVWTCTKTQYWIPNGKYNFAAVVNGTVATETEHLPATITYNADGTTDLLYARSATDILGKASDNDLVEFTFNHLLSKVMFTAKNSMTDSNYKYSLANLKVTGTSTTGTYTVGATTPWGNTNTTGATEGFGNINDVVGGVTEAKECTNERLIIPANYTNLEISFDLTWYYNGTAISTLTDQKKTASVNLQPGYAYNFVITTALNAPIQFTVEKAPEWNTPVNEVPAQ